MSKRSHRCLLLCLVLGLLAGLMAPAGSWAHPERGTKYPMPHPGKVPFAQRTGTTLVVCKPDSLSRLKHIFKGDPRGLRSRLQLLRACRFRHIQSAVNAAKSGYRIFILPGVYKEEPSRAVPVGGIGQEPCKDNYVETEGFANNAPPPAGPRSNDPPARPDRNYTRLCPNSKNLIVVNGDPRPEPTPLAPSLPTCIQKCGLQITGQGKGPKDVLIQGDRRKVDVLRIDRVNGIYLGNFTIEQAWFNDINIVESDGFHVTGVVARYAQNYGVLAFTSIHGLFDNIDAFGNGDSGVYPGSNSKGCNIDLNAYGLCDAGATTANPRAGCGDLTTEIKQVNSHDNVLGYSGTAGNATWVHDNKFHDNSTGLTTDSFASGHPGMPQECFKWENNVIASNNNNHFTAERQDYCRTTPFENRQKEIVCPQFQTAVGTGIFIAGGNRDLFQNNNVYDNWRWGAALISVPASLRGDNEPSHQSDTSNGNQFLNNQMGIAHDGSAAPNGVDFFWDGQGAANCWQGNASKSGPGHQSNFQNMTPSQGMPGCPGSETSLPPNPAVSSVLVPCTAWDPNNNPRPVACDWFDTPPKPS